MSQINNDTITTLISALQQANTMKSFELLNYFNNSIIQLKTNINDLSSNINSFNGLDMEVITAYVSSAIDELYHINTQFTLEQDAIINNNISQISDNIDINSSKIIQISGKLQDNIYQVNYQIFSGNINLPKYINSQKYIQCLIPTNIKLQSLAQQIYDIYQNQSIVQISQKSPVFVMDNGNTYKQFKFYYDENKKEIKYFNCVDDKDASEQDLQFLKRATISQIYLKALQKVKLPMYITFNVGEKLKYKLQVDDVDLNIKMNSKKNEKLYITLTNMSLYTKKIIINQLFIEKTLKIKVIPEYDKITITELIRLQQI